jgi:hypothetical protein
MTLVIERGTIAHRAKSAEFAKDTETLERYVGPKSPECPYRCASARLSSR